MPQVMPLSPGDPESVGRYRLTGRIIGLPGTGPVYLSASPEGTDVTVSMLGGDWTAAGAARDRFAAEATAARRVAPFCTARILDAGIDTGQAFLVSEHVAGPSLAELVSVAGPLAARELDAIAIGAVTGLASVHQAGLVHGAFDADCVILSADGPRVVEFSISPPYGAATPAADMFAWAHVVMLAAFGQPGSSAADVSNLQQSLGDAVSACLAPPADRPSARAVLGYLLGTTAPAVGLLAEGARRATEAVARASSRPHPHAMNVAAGPRHVAHQQSGPMGVVRSAAGKGPSAGRREAPGRRPTLGHRETPSRPKAPGRRPAARSADRPISRRHSAGRRPGPRTLVAVGAGAAVVLAAAVGIPLLHRQAKPPHSPATAASDSPGGVPASRSPSVPSALTGTWAGTARQTGPSSIAVQVTLTLRARTSGSVRYSFPSKLVCTAQLTVQSTSARSVTLRQVPTGCQNPIGGGSAQSGQPGTVTVTVGSSQTVRFSFQPVTGPGDSGTLTSH